MSAVQRGFRDDDGVWHPEPLHPKPTVVCLCGSTRFWEHFQEVGWTLTLNGEIVLSVGVSKHTAPDGGHAGERLGPGVAAMLDELHLRKIDMADYIFVLNVGGYIGESTRREIEYAIRNGKDVVYLEEEYPHLDDDDD